MIPCGREAVSRHDPGAAALCAQDRPLASLPYTPSLEPTFIDRAVDPCVDFFRYSPAAIGTRSTRFRPTSRGGAFTARWRRRIQQFLWGVLEQAAKPAADAHGERAEDRRFLRRVHGRSGGGEGRGGAAEGRSGRHRGARQASRTCRAVLARLHLGSARSNALFGFGASQDFANSEQRDRVRDGRRARAAGSRLLHEGRSEVRGDAREIRGARGAHVRTAGR